MAAELDNVLNLYKKKSETPLQTIERYVKAHPEYKDSRMTYAGRLDPMAEGLLLVLSGAKNNERAAYTGLDKDYEFEFVLGVATDTFDMLGKVTESKGPGVFSFREIGDVLEKKYVGQFEQKYPPYSSKVLNGVPLFELARQGKLQEKDLPSHQVTVSKIELENSRIVSKDDFVESTFAAISAVAGDFRQKEILKAWNEYFASGPAQFILYKARVSCGSGFYVRQLVQDIGRELGTGAVTVSILRTRVGEYKISDSIK